MRRLLLLCSLSGMLLLSSVAGNAQSAASLGELSGKVVWVDFWASWCAPCRRSFPWLNAMHRKYSTAGLQIIGVNVDKDRELADEFLGEVPAEFALRFDPEGELAEDFDVQAMPSSYLLDESGSVIVRHFGFKVANTEDYEQTILQALQQADSAQAIAE